MGVVLGARAQVNVDSLTHGTGYERAHRQSNDRIRFGRRVGRLPCLGARFSAALAVDQRSRLAPVAAVAGAELGRPSFQAANCNGG